jgi:hypothetical protein
MDIKKEEKKGIEIFCCYAHKDRSYLIELKNHLAVWERQQLITIWADVDISPGTNWRKDILFHLLMFRLILLLAC